MASLQLALMFQLLLGMKDSNEKMRSGKQRLEMLSQIAVALWRDDRGFVVSAEMILLAVIVVIGMVVGMASYRDALFQELSDTGSAIGEMNQSYSLAISSNPTKGITESGGLVVVNRDFGCIITQSSTRNFSYADQPDVCDVPAVAGEPPAGGSFVAARDEGE